MMVATFPVEVVRNALGIAGTVPGRRHCDTESCMVGVCYRSMLTVRSRWMSQSAARRVCKYRARLASVAV